MSEGSFARLYAVRTFLPYRKRGDTSLWEFTGRDHAAYRHQWLGSHDNA